MMVTCLAVCCGVITSGKLAIIAVLRAEVAHGWTIEEVVRCEKTRPPENDSAPPPIRSII